MLSSDAPRSGLSPEERNRLTDYFEPWELAQLLDINMEEFIDFFEDEIEDALDDINELMEFGEKDYGL